MRRSSFIARHWGGLIAVLLSLAAMSTQASVIIIGTRVVYPSDARDVTVRLTNNGETPALIQAWIDDGDPAMNAETAKVPFVLTPPLARIDKSKSQTLRLIYTGQGLPQDRETLFWLNVLEVPPKPEDGTNYLQFAVRTRIKVFYRPVALHKGEPSASVADVHWHIKSQAGKSVVLEASNPSPYYLSLSQVRLVAGGREVGAPMNVTLRPKSTEVVTVNDAESDTKVLSAIKYQVINDFGAMTEGEKALSAAP